MEVTAKPEVVWVEYDKNGMLRRLTNTVQEMAKLTGETEKHIRSIASRMKSGRLKSGRFARVELLED